MEMKLHDRIVAAVGVVVLLLCGEEVSPGIPPKPNDMQRSSLLLQSRQKRAALADPRRLWDNATVPYDIDPILPEYSITILKLSMREWEKTTCITFVPKTPSDANFVHFTRTDCGCCTPVGNKRNGSQFFSISPNCSQMGNIMHELGHTIGFYHEQSRPDRDKYIHVHFENIDKDLQHNFKMYKNLNSLGEPYDFDSIMHYPLTYPAKGGKLFMSVVNGTRGKHNYVKVGQRSVLSPGDIRQTNKLYKCPECGKTLIKSSGTLDYQGKELGVKYHSKNYFAKQLCQWRIIASKHDIVELKITRGRIPKNVNCSSYLEVRDGYYNSEVLKKICGAAMKSPNIIIRSTGSRMFVQFKLAPGARFWTPGFMAQYRTIYLNKFEGESGNFTSPGYPSFYPFLKLCHYLMKAPDFNVIQLTFHFVEIGEDELCEEEYIEIKNGEFDTAKSLGKFCGKKQSMNFTSSSNVLLVVFKSFTSNNLRGFFASYVTGKKKDILRLSKQKVLQTTKPPKQDIPTEKSNTKEQKEKSKTKKKPRIKKSK